MLAGAGAISGLTIVLLAACDPPPEEPPVATTETVVLTCAAIGGSEPIRRDFEHSFCAAAREGAAARLGDGVVAVADMAAAPDDARVVSFSAVIQGERNAEGVVSWGRLENGKPDIAGAAGPVPASSHDGDLDRSTARLLAEALLRVSAGEF